MKNVGNNSRGRSQGVPKIFRAPMYRVHCAVIFAIAQLSCSYIFLKQKCLPPTVDCAPMPISKISYIYPINISIFSIFRYFESVMLFSNLGQGRRRRLPATRAVTGSTPADVTLLGSRDRGLS